MAKPGRAGVSEALTEGETLERARRRKSAIFMIPFLPASLFYRFR